MLEDKKGEERAKRPWFEKPIGLIVVAFISGLLVAYAAFSLGLTK
jgi:hypothetical protein